MPKLGFRIFVGVVAIIFSILQIIKILDWNLAFRDVDNKFYVLLFISITAFGLGLYLLLSIKYYKNRYFPDRRIAEPVMYDGSKLRDNSPDLEEDITDDATRVTKYDLLKTKIAYFGVGLFYAGYLFFYFASDEFETPGLIFFTTFSAFIAFVIHLVRRSLQRKIVIEDEEQEKEKIPRPKSRDF